MQLYARDVRGSVVFANHALKQKDYICFECESIVRVRGGLHRQNHYYHLEAHRSCKLNAKSMTHIQIQCHLQKLFTPEECQLEHHFAEINRIADVVWAKHKLVFEIQCSTISAQEIMERNRDYAAIGHQVIWILHDKRFNQWRLSAAESVLKNFPHYYTNMDANGNGVIYDRYGLFHRGKRVGNLDPLEINLTTPVFLSEKEKIEVPSLILNTRMQNWFCGFSGDLLSKCLFDQKSFCETDYWFEIQRLESLFIEAKAAFSWKSLVNIILIKPYKQLFYYFLEKACR